MVAEQHPPAPLLPSGCMTTQQSNLDEWMTALDQEIHERSGVSVHDLADWHFADAFADGMSVKEAADEMLDEAGFPSE